jgi:hypothetical protein
VKEAVRVEVDVTVTVRLAVLDPELLVAAKVTV